MAGTVDLHVHSHYSSDGFHSPEELFAKAKGLGLKALVIADHDTLASVREAEVLAAETGVKTLPALELSTISNNRMVHILGYGVLPDTKGPLGNMMEKIQNSRKDIMPQIKANLESFGFFVNMERVYQLAAPAAPVITNFASAVIEDERNQNNPDLQPYLPGGAKSAKPAISFIKDYLVAGSKGYVPEYIVDIMEGIQAIAESGGVPVIAHPGEWFTVEDESLMPKMLNCGLAGVEVYTPYHDEKKQRYFEALAGKHGLLATAGSDYHSLRHKPGHEMGGVIQANETMYEALAQAIYSH